MTRYIEIAISKDRQPFGDYTLHPTPRQGKFDDPMPTRRRCGRGREFVVDFRYTEPTDFVFLGVEIQVG